MRSMAGVGMTPPKVLGAPKPWSSVMMSSTFGAPFGGTPRGAHHAFDSEAFSVITPPNFGSGGGSCFPSIVVVALGEPKVPVTCWALLGPAISMAVRVVRMETVRAPLSLIGLTFICYLLLLQTVRSIQTVPPLSAGSGDPRRARNP